jgi:iron(III) transport system permease protein
MAMRRSTAWLISIAILGVFGVALLWPLAWVIRGGFLEDGRFTLRFLAGVFQNPVYVEGLIRSLWIAVGTTTLVLLIAVPLAWMANRYQFPGKPILQALLLVPMILPPFVGAIGFQQIFGVYGSFNVLLARWTGLGPIDVVGQAGYWGVITLQALSLYPVMYLSVVAALGHVDPAMEQVAANLGARGVTRFRRITLPLIMPGLFAGATIVFVWAFTELGTPLIMGYTRCTPVQIFDALKEIGTNPFPYALVFVMLAASVLLYSLARVVLGGGHYALQADAPVAAAPVPLGLVGRIGVPLAFATVTGAALIPHLGVILTSFAVPGTWYRSVLPHAFTMENYADALGHPLTVLSIKNSLLYASLAVAVDLILGLTIALVVVRSDLPVRGFLDSVAMLPLAVPGLVIAFGYLSVSAWLARLDVVKDSLFLRQLVDVQTNPTLFLALAYAIRRLPYMVRSAVAGLQQTSVTLEEAATNLGARSFTTLRRITMPLITANIIGGILLAFAFSMLEVSDSLMLAQRQDSYPITKTIYELFQLIGTGAYVASALGVWAMAFLAVTIIGASAILGRRLGALFRV